MMANVFTAHGVPYIRVCATCEHWEKDEKKPNAGLCNWRLSSDAPVRNCHTMDLSVCSKWQEKATATIREDTVFARSDENQPDWIEGYSELKANEE